eukprot:1182749-Prorocentrum_minimum.AAC.3
MPAGGTRHVRGEQIYLQGGPVTGDQSREGRENIPGSWRAGAAARRAAPAGTRSCPRPRCPPACCRGAPASWCTPAGREGRGHQKGAKGGK